MVAGNIQSGSEKLKQLAGLQVLPAEKVSLAFLLSRIKNSFYCKSNQEKIINQYIKLYNTIKSKKKNTYCYCKIILFIILSIQCFCFFVAEFLLKKYQ